MRSAYVRRGIYFFNCFLADYVYLSGNIVDVNNTYDLYIAISLTIR